MSIDEFMNALEPGDAWLRVAPIDKGWRQERVRVALPQDVPTSSEKALGKAVGNHGRNGARDFSEVVVEGAPEPAMHAEPRRLPPECPADLVEKIGADILAKVERRWPKRRHELGPCLVWRDGEATIKAAGCVYGRQYDSAIKRSDAAHRVVWRRVYGPISKGMTVDHLCWITLCQRPDHLELVTWAENTRRRHQRG